MGSQKMRTYIPPSGISAVPIKQLSASAMEYICRSSEEHTTKGRDQLTRYLTLSRSRLEARSLGNQMVHKLYVSQIDAST